MFVRASCKHCGLTKYVTIWEPGVSNCARCGSEVCWETYGEEEKEKK